jgi:hypothetical protein
MDRPQIEIYLRAHPDLAARLTEDSERGRVLAALSAALFWDANYAKYRNNNQGPWILDGKLNDNASTIIWGRTGVNNNQQSAFKRISNGIGLSDALLRWENYQEIVRAVLDGGNPYEELREALARLGLTTDSGQGYEQRFGIALRSLTPAPIQGTPAHLLAETLGEDMTASMASNLTTAEEARLFAEAESLLAQLSQISNENQIMWIPNFRSASEFTLGVAISIVAVSSALAADNYVLGKCYVVQGPYVTEGKGIHPIFNAASYLVMHLGGDPDKNLERVGGDFEGGKITLVKAPQHGKLVLSSDEREASWDWYRYFPEEGFYGQDRFVMQVEKDGVKVTIHYVMEIITNEEASLGVCEQEEWKISFADLPGSSLAQTTGTGATAQITLSQIKGSVSFMFLRKELHESMAWKK